MACVKFDKGSREWLMFQDYWKLCQKFWVPEDNDGYWEGLVREIDRFYEKYKDVILTKGLALELLGCLEEKSKKECGNSKYASG